MWKKCPLKMHPLTPDTMLCPWDLGLNGLNYFSTQSPPLTLTFQFISVLSTITPLTEIYPLYFASIDSSWDNVTFKSILSLFKIEYIQSLLTFNEKQLHLKFLSFYGTGLYRDCTWLVANAKQWNNWIIWPYKDYGWRIMCCPLASTLFNFR